ncbi:MAG: ECF transporter S component [Bacilli bacterium]
MKKNNIIKKMTINAVIIALIAIMSFVPYIGYITIPGIGLSITIIHVIVLFAAACFGIGEGAVAGFAFGLFSLIKAASNPGSALDYYFVNPLVSILPRLVFGLVSGLVFFAIKKLNNQALKYSLFVVSCGVLTVFHSIITLSMFYIFAVALGNETMTYFALISGIFTINGLVETLCAVVFSPAITIAISAAFPKLCDFKIKRKQQAA